MTDEPRDPAHPPADYWVVLGHFPGRPHEFIISTWSSRKRAEEAMERARGEDAALVYRVAHVVEEQSDRAP